MTSLQPIAANEVSRLLAKGYEPNNIALMVSKSCGVHPKRVLNHIKETEMKKINKTATSTQEASTTTTNPAVEPSEQEKNQARLDELKAQAPARVSKKAKKSAGSNVLTEQLDNAVTEPVAATPAAEAKIEAPAPRAKLLAKLRRKGDIIGAASLEGNFIYRDNSLYRVSTAAGIHPLSKRRTLSLIAQKVFVPLAAGSASAKGHADVWVYDPNHAVKVVEEGKPAEPSTPAAEASEAKAS